MCVRHSGLIQLFLKASDCFGIQYCPCSLNIVPYSDQMFLKWPFVGFKYVFLNVITLVTIAIKDWDVSISYVLTL